MCNYLQYSTTATSPCTMYSILYRLKFLRLKIFVNFVGQARHEKFLKQNFSFIAAAMRDRELDHRSFIHENFVFEQNSAKIFSARNF